MTKKARRAKEIDARIQRWGEPHALAAKLVDHEYPLEARPFNGWVDTYEPFGYHFPGQTKDEAIAAGQVILKWPPPTREDWHRLCEESRNNPMPPIPADATFEELANRPDTMIFFWPGERRWSVTRGILTS